MKQRKKSRRPNKKFRSSYAGKRDEGTRVKSRKPESAFINRVSKAGKPYRIAKQRHGNDEQPRRRPKAPLRLPTTMEPSMTDNAVNHRQQRQSSRQKNKQSDSVNKLLVSNHLANRTSSKEKLKKIVSSIKSRGLRQRLMKKIQKTYGGA